MLSWMINDLLRCLDRAKPPKLRVVVMPDFFVDRFVTFRGDVDRFSASIAEVASRRGGNIHGVKQVEMRGGNAANTAAASAMLGAKVYPIITTSPLGFQMLEYYLGPLGVDLYHIKADGEVALTTAFEFVQGEEEINVMIGDLGSLPSFGPEDLTERDYKLLEEADYVCVFNWASTRKWGTELAEEVFRFVKENGRGKTYYDTGDPTPNHRNISKLVKKVLKAKLIDIFSVNENEAFQYASQMDNGLKRLRNKVDRHELAKKCARTLAKGLGTRLDLHTSALSGSFTEDNETVVPSFHVTPLRSTGAGDSWNAGNIYGDALKLPDSCRLTMANAVAAYYVTSAGALHPSMPRLVEYCEEQKKKLG